MLCDLIWNGGELTGARFQRWLVELPRFHDSDLHVELVDVEKENLTSEGVRSWVP